MNNILKKFLLLAAYIVLILIFTFPLCINISEYIPRFVETTEPLSILNDFWWLKFSFFNNLDFHGRNHISVPFGVPFTAGASSYPLWDLFNRNVIILSSEVCTYNLNILLGYVCAGIFMYALVIYFTSSPFAAALSTMIYTFSPHHVVRTWQHLGLAHTGWLILYILYLFKLRGILWSRKNIFLTVLALFLVFSFDFYYGYFAVIITILFILFLFICQSKNKINKKQGVLRDLSVVANICISFIICMFLLFPVIMPFLRELFVKIKPEVRTAFTAHHRPFEDLFSQSAKPLSYFLPSAVHPIFGKLTESFIGTELYGDSLTEHTLYLGWIPLALAFAALRRWRRNRKSLSHQVTKSPGSNEDFYIGFFVFLAVAAWLFSQPPWWDIFGFKLYMPSFFMYKILPMFRAYCRFGIVVMLAVAVLAGYGLKFILERFKSRKTKVAITALFCGLVLFEFWNWPPYKVIDISKVPAVYYWIKEQPKDIVIADYPLDADSPNELYKFFQTVHEKKIINGTIPGTHANKVAQEIRRLSQPKTASILKWMGVKYVIVHKDDYLKTDLIEDKEDLEKIPKNPSLKFVKSFQPQECPDPNIMCVQKTGPVDVYEVIANPIKPEIDQ